MSENSALYWSFWENHVQSLWKSQLYTGQWRNLSVFLTNGSVRVFATALAMHSFYLCPLNHSPKKRHLH